MSLLDTQHWHELAFRELSIEHIEELAKHKLKELKTKQSSKRKRRVSLEEQERNLRTDISAFDPVKLLQAAAFWSSLNPPAARFFGEGNFMIQSTIELLQAIFLSQNGTTDSCRAPISWRDIKRINSRLLILVETISTETTAPILERTELENLTTNMLCKVVTAEHLIRRNPGYINHTDAILVSLLKPIEAIYRKDLGYHLSDVISFIRQLQKLCARKSEPCLDQCLKLYETANKAELLEAFRDIEIQVGFTGQVNISELTFRKLREAAIDFAIQNLPSATLSWDEIASCAPEIPANQLRRLVDNLSMAMGATIDLNLVDLAIDNPASQRPFIKLTDTLFSIPNPGAFSNETLEAILADPLIQSTGLSNKIRKKISKTAEQLVASRLEDFFPSCVFQSVKLTNDPILDDLETDVVVTKKGLLIACEVKSRKVASKISQGNSLAMKQTVSRLVHEPAMQCRKFTDAILNSSHPIIFSSELVEAIQIDKNELDLVLSFAVNIFHMGSWANSAQLLKRSGLVKEDFPTIPNFSIFDFFAMLDYLETPERLIHYLDQRQTLERTSTYFGDELDLLGQYFQDRLTLTNLRPEVYDRRSRMYRFASPLNPIEQYLSMKETFLGLPEEAKLRNEPIPKPLQEYSPLWQRLISGFQDQQVVGWSKLLTFLLSTPPSIRREIEQLLKEIVSNKELRHEPALAPFWQFHNQGTETACSIIIHEEEATTLGPMVDQAMKLAFEHGKEIDWVFLILFKRNGLYSGAAYAARSTFIADNAEMFSDN